MFCQLASYYMQSQRPLPMQWQCPKLLAHAQLTERLTTLVLTSIVSSLALGIGDVIQITPSRRLNDKCSAVESILTIMLIVNYEQLEPWQWQFKTQTDATYSYGFQMDNALGWGGDRSGWVMLALATKQ